MPPEIGKKKTKKKQTLRHKSKRKKSGPAVGNARNRTAQVGDVVPPPAPPLKVPGYLKSDSKIPALEMAQWAIIDARSMDRTSIGRVHLPKSMKILDKTISGLMSSRDERSKRAGASLLRLMQDGEDNRYKVEMQLRETSLEAYQAGVSAQLQANIDEKDAGGVSVDVLGQVEAHIQEVVDNAVEQALKKGK